MEHLVSVLAALACPVGMGLMMWLMMRGHQRQNAQTTGQGITTLQSEENPVIGQPPVEPSPDVRLAALRARLGDVQAQQAAIVAQLDRLATWDQSAESRVAAPSQVREPAAQPANSLVQPEQRAWLPPGSYCQ